MDPVRSAHNRLHEFVKHLASKHDITILCIRDWWKAQQTDVSQYYRGLEEIWSHVEIRYFSDRRISPIAQELFSVATLGRLLAKVGTVDVHFNYNTLVSGLYAAIWCRRNGVRTVYDLADDLPAMIRTSPQIPRPLRPFGGAFAQWMVYNNLAIATNATLTTGTLDLPKRFQEKFRIIPNGVDLNLFRKTEKSTLCEKLRLGNSFVIGYAGVLREWIDFEPVFQALASLRRKGLDIKFLVIGEEGGISRPKELAARFGVSEDVIFAGTIPYSSVPEYISCMDVGLIPFRENKVAASALPLKLFEYMACEVPVISTRVPAIETVMQEAVLYVSGSQELAKTINNLRQNPQMGRKLGLEGRNIVERCYDWKKRNNELEELLNLVARK